jgi:hypothetical protein
MISRIDYIDDGNIKNIILVGGIASAKELPFNLAGVNPDVGHGMKFIINECGVLNCQLNKFKSVAKLISYRSDKFNINYITINDFELLGVVSVKGLEAILPWPNKSSLIIQDESVYVLLSK